MAGMLLRLLPAARTSYTLLQSLSHLALQPRARYVCTVRAHSHTRSPKPFLDLETRLTHHISAVFATLPTLSDNGLLISFGVKTVQNTFAAFLPASVLEQHRKVSWRHFGTKSHVTFTSGLQALKPRNSLSLI